MAELSPETKGDLAGRGDVCVECIPAEGMLKKNDLLSHSGYSRLPCMAMHTWNCIRCPWEYIVEGTLGLSQCI